MNEDTHGTNDADEQHTPPDDPAEQTSHLPTTRRTFLGSIAAASALGGGGTAAAMQGGGAGALAQEAASSHGYGIGGYGEGPYGGDGDTDPQPGGPPALPGQDDAPQDLNGDGLYRDVNGDGQFTPDVMKRAGGDFTVLGSAYPDFEFGFQNTVTLGNFELRANVTGSFGGLNHRSEFFRTSRNIDGLFNVDSGYVENFYRSPENPGDGLTPSPLGPAFGRQQYRDASHSAILSESSNIWLRSAMVRYNFGENSQLVGFSNVSVYLTGKNLLILSPYPGNPDTASMTNRLAPGLDLGNYPLPRSFTFGVDVSL
jgi:hypothetical protein